MLDDGLNSVFLHHVLYKAGMTSVMYKCKAICIPLSKMTKEDIEICEELLFTPDDNSLFKFIEHFSEKKIDDSGSDEEFEALSDEEKISKLTG